MFCLDVSCHGAFILKFLLLYYPTVRIIMYSLNYLFWLLNIDHKKQKMFTDVYVTDRNKKIAYSFLIRVSLVSYNLSEMGFFLYFVQEITTVF